MNEKLRNALDNIFDARVPDMWKRGSWASSSIGFWFSELLDRNRQFSSWLFTVSFIDNSELTFFRWYKILHRI